jgi:hypothetical protein
MAATAIHETGTYGTLSAVEDRAGVRAASATGVRGKGSAMADL